MTTKTDPKTFPASETITETERLILRTVTTDDADFLCQLFNNPEVMKYYGITRNLEQTLRWIEFSTSHRKQHGTAKCLIVRKSDGQPLGHSGLIATEIDGTKEIELGYFLDNQFWGHGFATEAANAGLKLAFEKLRLPRIVSAMNPKNLPSIEVAKRLGMKWEKSARAKVGDYSWDCDVYAIANPTNGDLNT